MLKATSNYALNSNQNLKTNHTIFNAKCYQRSGILNNSKKDIFFSGKQYPSGYYEINEIDDAKKALKNKKTNEDKDKWKDELFAKRDHKGWGILDGDDEGRALLGIYSLGLAEAVNQISRKIDKHKLIKKTKEHISRVERLIIDLENEELNKKLAEAEKKDERLKLKENYLKQKSNIQENYLMPLFVTQIERDRKNKSADIPNSLMLVGPDSKAINELIDWTGRNSDCNFVKIKHTDDLLECLEEAEDNYQENENKKRTLIHVEGLDKLLNPKISPDHTIGALKDIMCATSEDYHSTIIFSTKDPSKLDSIAIGDNRVDHRIDVNLKKPL